MTVDIVLRVVDASGLSVPWWERPSLKLELANIGDTPVRGTFEFDFGTAGLTVAGWSGLPFYLSQGWWSTPSLSFWRPLEPSQVLTLSVEFSRGFGPIAFGDVPLAVTADVVNADVGGSDRAGLDLTVTTQEVPRVFDRSFVVTPGVPALSLDVAANLLRGVEVTVFGGDGLGGLIGVTYTSGTDEAWNNAPLSIASVGATSAAGGRVILQEGGARILYVAPEGFAGEDRFTAHVRAPTGEAAAKTVFVTVGETGTAQDDTIVFAAGGGTVAGLAGNDLFFGGDGADTAFGGDGFDVFYLGAGANLMDGGAGDDFYQVRSAGDRVRERPGEGFDTLFVFQDGWTTDAAVELVNLMENAARFTFTGATGVVIAANDALASTIEGGSGDDRLWGGAAGGTLIGNAGDDVLRSRVAAHEMRGGVGDDTYNVRFSADRVIELAGDGFDTLFVEVQDFRLPENIEAAYLLDPLQPQPVWPLSAPQPPPEAEGGLPPTRLFAHDSGATLGANPNRASELVGGAGDDVLGGASHPDLLRPGAGANVVFTGGVNGWVSGPANARDDAWEWFDRVVLTPGAGPDTVVTAARLGLAVIEGFAPGLDRLVLLAWNEAVRAERRGDDTLVISDLGDRWYDTSQPAAAVLLRGVTDFDLARDLLVQEDFALIPPGGGVIIVGGGGSPPPPGIDMF